jgi:hypothetical protein
MPDRLQVALLVYALATAMNLTILFEVTIALVLFSYVVFYLVKSGSKRSQCR